MAADDVKRDEQPSRHEQHGDGDAEEQALKQGKESTEEKKDAGPPLYKRPLFWIIGGAIVAILLIGGFFYWLHARRYTSTDDAFIDAHIVRLAAEESGKLIAVTNVDNRHVRAGQLLAVIEPSRPEAQVAQQQAAVLQAEAGLRQAEAQVEAQRAQRAQAAANALAPAADAEKARLDYARYLNLRRIDPAATAATQIDQAKANAESTAAQAAGARRQLQTADAQILVARRQVDAARAQLRAAQAKLGEVQVTVNHLRIIAPVAGQVVNRSVNIGSYVAPGQQLMAIIPDHIWVTANFKETQLAHMKPGQHVDIRIDAFPDLDFEGHVDSIQRGAGQAFAILPPQNATGNYVKVVQRVPVRILFDRPDPRRYPLGPGMSVVPTVRVR